MKTRIFDHPSLQSFTNEIGAPAGKAPYEPLTMLLFFIAAFCVVNGCVAGYVLVAHGVSLAFCVF